jgi:hypothetical protein
VPRAEDKSEMETKSSEMAASAIGSQWKNQ